MAFCTKCGTQYEAGTAFCGDCGTAVAVTATIQPSFSKDAPQARSADDITTAEMKFIGKNYDYFNRKWTITGHKKSKRSWNWAAFFLPLPWMAYRRMYRYCWIFLGIAVIIDISNAALGFPEMLTGAIAIAILITSGWLGNSLYQYHVQKKVHEITAMNSPEQVDAELARQGGTKIGEAIGFTIVALAMSTLIGVLAIEWRTF